jgi:hypothetical protein
MIRLNRSGPSVLVPRFRDVDLHEIITGEEFAIFRALLKPAALDDLHRLRGRIAVHLDSLEEQSFSHEFLDLELARVLTDGLTELIDGASGYDAEERSLVRGAVDYYVLPTDAENDVTSPIGLEDDARVFNAVCRALGRSTLEIPLP